MAVTLKSDMKVYDPRIQGGFREKLYQNLDGFAASAAGQIFRMTSINKPGDYDYTAFWKQTAGIVRRRDLTSVAPVTPIKVEQGEHAKVKVSRGIGPVDVTLDALRKAGVSGVREDGAMFALGEKVADAVMHEQVNTAIACVANALAAQVAVFHDYSATGVIANAALVAALAKRGDRAQDIALWVMHSKVFYDLVGAQIASSVSGVGDVVLASGSPITLNRPVLVTDSAKLIVAGTPDDYLTLGLTAGAVEVENTEEEYMYNDVISGGDNIIQRLQGEYAYNVGLMGMTWDIANGGPNPTDAALATGTNWDMVVADAKGLGGIVLRTQ